MRVLRMLTCACIVLSTALCALTLCQTRSISPEIMKLTQKPSVVDLWQNKKSSENIPVTSIESPLVVQARIYANLLNPLKPKSTQEIRSLTVSTPSPTIPEHTSIPQVTPPRVSPQFKVLATSVFSKAPEKSMALISEPGKGLSWVRPGDMLGYLRVIEIRTDAVVYTFEDTLGEVAWIANRNSPPLNPKLSSAPLAINTPRPEAPPTHLPHTQANLVTSRLGTPSYSSLCSLSPRPRRGEKRTKTDN